MSIPAGTKFIGISPDVDTYERKSTQANSPSNVYTIEDIQGSNVPSNRTITINGTTQDLSANRTWTISTGLTVGTTPVTSGTDGRVLFQDGGVLQQDAAFFWDNTNKRLGIGATPSSSVRLDVRAQGTLSTDVAFRVRDSADTGNIFEVRGNGHSVFNNLVFIGFGAGQTSQGHYFNMRFGASSSIPFAYFDNNANNLDIDRFCNIKLGFTQIATNSTHSLLLGLGTQPSNRNYQQTMASLTCISQGTNDSGFSQSGADTSGNTSLYYNYFGRNFVVGSTTQGTGSRKIVINSGTAPSTNLTDAFQLYSADRGGVAGKASAYFRTEDGSINVLGDLSGIGTSTPQARLDVIAQGALSTDIAFRIRNSADTANLVDVNGIGEANIKVANSNFVYLNSTAGESSKFTGQNFIANTAISGVGVNRTNMVLINAANSEGSFAAGTTHINTNAGVATGIQIGTITTNSHALRLGGFTSQIGLNLNVNTGSMVIGSNMSWVGGGSSSGMFVIGNNVGAGVVNGHANAIVFGVNQTDFIIGGGKGNIGINYNPTGRTETNTIFVNSGTAPTTSIADVFQLYSADIVAGNAAPHFRTEVGDIIKLYKQSSAGITTVADLVNVLTNLGLLG